MYFTAVDGDIHIIGTKGMYSLEHHKSRLTITNNARRQLAECFVTGDGIRSDLFAQTYVKYRELRDAALHIIFRCDNGSFILNGETAVDMNGDPVEIEGSVYVAHPIEMNADEIVSWRCYLNRKRVSQPFRQMFEPIVLVNGTLPDAVPGDNGLMVSDRYLGMSIHTNEMSMIAEEFGVQYHQEYDFMKSGRIDAINVITPGGMLPNCTRGRKRKNDTYGFRIKLGSFIFNSDIRPRTLNHSIALIDLSILNTVIAEDRADILQNLLPGMSRVEMLELHAKAVDSKRKKCRLAIEECVKEVFG